MNQMIKVGWLLDGLGGPIQSDQTLTLEEGRVKSIEPSNQVVFDAKEIKDLSHATLLPALMDAHVHLTFSGTLNVKQRRSQLQQSYFKAENAIHKHLQTCVKNGVAAVRDAGDCHGWVYKSQLFKKWPIQICTTGWAWHAPGRYGKMIGQTPVQGESLLQAIQRGPLAIDHIKIIQSGINSLDHFGHETTPQFTLPEMIAVQRFARQNQKAVMVHANGEKPVQIALEAQCDSIEHGYFMGLDNLHRMVDQQVFWVPTLIPMEALIHPGVVSRSQNAIACRILERQMEQVFKANEIGVRIVLGTDAGSLGVDHGVAVRQELALLIQAGLSLPRAIQCATAEASQLLGLKDRGIIRPGGYADFIVIPGRLENTLSDLDRIENLWIEGIPKLPIR